MNTLLATVCLLSFVYGIASQCTGMDDPACASWNANGFCTNTGYDIEMRKKYCGVSCGLCNTDGTQTAAGGGTDLTPCADANANCVAWNADPNNLFCSRTDYTDSMKLLYCCNTCRPYIFT